MKDRLLLATALSTAIGLGDILTPQNTYAENTSRNSATTQLSSKHFSGINSNECVQFSDRFNRPLDGVYKPKRLDVQQPCTTVTGTIDCKQKEPDGDIHILVRLDEPYERILNSSNGVQVCLPWHPGRHLVVERIPQHCKTRQEKEAVKNCADKGGFISPKIPQIGSHVSVTGPYVIDKGHEIEGIQVLPWAEIHPVWEIKRIL